MGKREKPNNRPLILAMINGKKRHMALGGASVIIAAVVAYMIPLAISITVDYVLRGDVTGIPPIFLGVVTGLSRERLLNNLYIPALFIVFLMAINAFFTFVRGQQAAFASEGVAKYLRDALFSHLQKLTLDYHKHAKSGDLVQRCTSDVDTVRKFISLQLFEILRTVFMFIIAITIMLSIDVRMALISMVTLPFLAVATYVYFKYVQRLFGAADEAEGRLSTALQENVNGVRVVRAFGQQESELERLTNCNEDFRAASYKLSLIAGRYWGASDAVGYLQIALTLTMSAYFAVNGTFTVGNLILFTTYSSMLTWPIRQLGKLLADLGKARVSLSRLKEILDAKEEAEPGRALDVEIRGEVEFKHVSFAYDSDVLTDISFSAHPGQTIAILGSTGSGKTSLVHLLQRLYQPSRGEILIDGVNILDISAKRLRKSVSIVMQEPFLFSRTIGDNIRIANMDAPMERVIECAKAAAVHDTIMAFENGYDTVVGERGVTLSGGQRQRVAIARMLMQSAPILIFDDSMSALDANTDALLREAVYKQNKTGTTFIISHRVATLSKADKILVLSGGKIAEQGTNAELVALGGIYAEAAKGAGTGNDGAARPMPPAGLRPAPEN